MLKHARPNRRLLITKNLILMLVLFVVIGLAIYAWFALYQDVDASNMQVQIRSVDNVEIALPEKIEVNNEMKDSFPNKNEDWSSEINFKKSGYFVDLVKDVTSNGEQFVVPNFEAANNLEEGRKVIKDDVWVNGLSSKDAITNRYANDDDQYHYVSFDFYVRSQKRSISVQNSSFLAAGSELGFDGTNTNSQNSKDLKGSNIYRRSTYGAAEGDANAFSADALVGAMRVSLVGAPVDSVRQSGGLCVENSYLGATWASAAKRKLVWLPRPDIYLKTDNASNNWKLFTGIKPSGNVTQGELSGSQIDNIANKTYCHSFYKGDVIEPSGGNSVNKGLTAGAYCDPAVKTISGAATNKEFFVVSDTRNDEDLGETGHYPTLGKNLTVGDNALDSSKDIRFTGTGIQGDNRPIKDYYIYKYTLNLWIEGEDAEARRSMNEGAFSLELDFG